MEGGRGRVGSEGRRADLVSERERLQAGDAQRLHPIAAAGDGSTSVWTARGLRAFDCGEPSEQGDPFLGRKNE